MCATPRSPIDQEVFVLDEVIRAAGPLEVVVGASAWTVATLAVVAACVRLVWSWPASGTNAARRSAAELGLGTALAVVFFMVLSVTVLGFIGLLTGFGLLLVSIVFYVVSRRLPSPHGLTSLASQWTGRPSDSWPLILTALIVGVDVVTHLPSPPIGWDAMTYHLFFPARWLQEGRLVHVPAVFSDNAAAFAPQNGAAFFAWQMGLVRRDALIDVVQVGVLAILALAFYLLCRHLTIRRQPAALATATLLWLPPVRQWAWSANVDIFMVACWLAAFYWQFRYLRYPKASTIVALGLAGGLAAGTKTLGLPLMAMSFLPLAWVLTRQVRWRHLGLLVVAGTIGGGWWYLRNLWLYGNPLFPLEVSIGGWKLAGAYGGAAVRAGEFHLPTAAAVMRSVVASFGLGVCLLTVFGLLVVAFLALSRSRPVGIEPHRRRTAGAMGWVVLLAAGWTVFFFVVVPHNDQARFLLPTLVLGLVGWAFVLQWAGSRSRTAALALWSVGVIVAVVAAPPWGVWAARLGALSAGGVAVVGWLSAATVLGAAAVWAFTRGRGLLGPVALVSLVALAGIHGDRVRAPFLARASFNEWREGYLPFNEPHAPPEGLRIAYTGANVPYALMGSGWRHRVTYVNTQGELGDGFYEFWRRDPRTYPYHKPGLYRGHDRYETWLEHLDARRIDLVVIFRLHLAERRYIESSAEGFPIERSWVGRHPQRFELVFQGETAAIYRVLPAADGG